MKCWFCVFYRPGDMSPDVLVDFRREVYLDEEKAKKECDRLNEDRESSWSPYYRVVEGELETLTMERKVIL